MVNNACPDNGGKKEQPEIVGQINIEHLRGDYSREKAKIRSNREGEKGKKQGDDAEKKVDCVQSPSNRDVAEQLAKLEINSPSANSNCQTALINKTLIALTDPLLTACQLESS